MSTQKGEPVEYGPPQLPAITSETAAVLSLIERAARDPNVDLDKMERLFAMRDRIRAQTAEDAYAAALSEMQPKLPIVDEKGFHEGTKRTYAKWDDVSEALRPVLSAFGFSLQFRSRQEPGKVYVTGTLRHRAGHKEETTVELPADTSGQKNAVQGVGSSQSYGMRYAAKLLLGLSSRKSDDDDGKTAGGAVTDEQADRLRGLLTETKSDVGKFLEFLKAESISDIPAKDYERAIRLLETKRMRM